MTKAVAKLPKNIKPKGGKMSKSLKFFEGKIDKKIPTGKCADEKVQEVTASLADSMVEIELLLMKCKNYSVKDGCRNCKKCTEKLFVDELYEFIRKWI